MIPQLVEVARGSSMGAWGSDTFENDDAVDFASEVERSSDLSVVKQALDAVVQTLTTVNAPVASAGLAAAGIVARLRGHFGQQNSYTAPIDEWVRVHSGAGGQARRLIPDESVVAAEA